MNKLKVKNHFSRREKSEIIGNIIGISHEKEDVIVYQYWLKELHNVGPYKELQFCPVLLVVVSLQTKEQTNHTVQLNLMFFTV